MNASLFGIWLVTFYGTCHGQRILNTFHYRINAMSGTPTVEDVANAMYTEMTDTGKLVEDFLAVMPQNYTLSQVWIQQLTALRSAKQIYANGTIGSLAVDAVTANVATVITRRGAGGTRRDVGSLHLLVPPTSTYLVDGEITSTYATAVAPLVTQVQQAITVLSGGVSFGPVLYHPGQTPNYTPIDAAFIQDSARVMRRRTLGLGI